MQAKRGACPTLVSSEGSPKVSPVSISPVYQAFCEGGREGALRYLLHVEAELRAVMLLTGCRNVAALHTLEPVITGELRDYVRPGVTLRAPSVRAAASEVSA